MNHRINIGLDVHARSVHGAAFDLLTGEVRTAKLPAADGEVLGWVLSQGEPLDLAVTYEAGPTGFHLARTLQENSVPVLVCAPSLVPNDSGTKRRKNDRNDAIHLARCLAAGQLHPVAIPTATCEAARDLLRAHRVCQSDLQGQKKRISSMLLRYGYVWPKEKSTWTREHRDWICSIDLGQPDAKRAFDSLYERLIHTEQMRISLEKEFCRMASDPEFSHTVANLNCLRGLSTLSTLSFAVEVGDFSRFTPKTFPSWLGLVPSEDSSGESHTTGSITKMGNYELRRILVEAAWKNGKPFRPDRTPRIARAMEKVSPQCRTRALAANRRFAKRWADLDARGMRNNKIAVAVAREMATFVCELALID